MKKGLKFLFVLICYFFNSRACQTDHGCKECNLYYFDFGPFTLGFYNCDKCKQNHHLNQETFICDCNDGFYRSSPSSCSACPKYCSSCSGEQTCLVCTENYGRVLTNGTCECSQGFESKDGSAQCTKKSHTLLIALVTAGVVLLLILGFLLYWILRKRNESLQVHQSTVAKTRNIEIEQNDDISNCSIMATPVSLWAKQWEFKPEQICSICLDCRPLFITVCGHYFHPQCIFQWLGTHTNCPNCNNEISQKQLKRWCSGCCKNLMPVTKSNKIKRGKSKKQLIKTGPLNSGLCHECEGKSVSRLQQIGNLSSAV